MSRAILDAMVEAAKKATPGKWRSAGAVIANDAGATIAVAIAAPRLSPVTGLLDNADHILATQPTNILALDEYVRGLEEKAAAVIRADEEFRRHLPEGTERDPVTVACDELRAALGAKP